MLKNSTMKIMLEKANKEVELLKKRGYNAEIVNIPIVVMRNEDGSVTEFTTFNSCIIPEENKINTNVKFSLEDFNNSYMCINCETIKEAEELKKIFKNNGINTCNMIPAWKVYGKTTCYRIEGELEYCGTIKQYSKDGYDIVKFSDIEF